MVKIKKDLTGKKFGRLTVKEKDTKKSKGRNYWICECDCGNIKSIRTDALTCGHTKSCGCLNKETQFKPIHGMKNTRLYNVWGGMKNRCRNKNSSDYVDYGGRGISYCKEWEDFIPFYNWAIENGYEEGLSIDRVDNNGNYEPSNCRWATTKQQANNRRTNVITEYKGQKFTLKELSEKLDISYYTVISMRDRGVLNVL